MLKRKCFFLKFNKIIHQMIMLSPREILNLAECIQNIPNIMQERICWKWHLNWQSISNSKTYTCITKFCQMFWLIHPSLILKGCNYQQLEYHNLMSIHFYDIGIFFSSYWTTCGFQFFLPFHFLFAHTLKQPHKCHYKLENTPSFLYTSVQATYC